MKANELRIGNYLLLQGVTKPMQVFIIDTTEQSTQTKASPIPLTEDWLLKFGFKRKQIKDLSSYTLPKLELYQYSSNNNKIFFEYADGEVELKYVHQLQNLYFALTGMELKYGGGEQ
jgi:hypothetical protein